MIVILALVSYIIKNYLEYRVAISSKSNPIALRKKEINIREADGVSPVAVGDKHTHLLVISLSLAVDTRSTAKQNEQFSSCMSEGTKLETYPVPLQ